MAMTNKLKNRIILPVFGLNHCGTIATTITAVAIMDSCSNSELPGDRSGSGVSK